jgi:type IV pilus assembly protein PilE
MRVRSELQGLTLIEVLVVLTIIGLLAALANSSYNGVVQRSRRLDAQLALLRVAQAQERHYAQHLRYARTLGNTANPEQLALSPHSESGDYQLVLDTSATGQIYIVSALADPEGRQRVDVACQRFELDATGAQRAADASGHWHNEPNPCWRK